MHSVKWRQCWTFCNLLREEKTGVSLSKGDVLCRKECFRRFASCLWGQVPIYSQSSVRNTLAWNVKMKYALRFIVDCLYEIKRTSCQSIDICVLAHKFLHTRRVGANLRSFYVRPSRKLIGKRGSLILERSWVSYQQPKLILKYEISTFIVVW